MPFDEKRLSKLRADHNQDFSFFRNGDFIYISPDTDQPLGEGEEIVDVDFDTAVDLTASAVRHVFFRSFVRLFGRTPLSFHPLRFFSQKHDAIWKLVPDDLRGKLGFRKQIEVQLRVQEFGGEKLIGAVYNVDYRWFNSISCERMFAEGFDLTGLSVVHSVPIMGAETVLAPDEILIGTVESLSDQNGTAMAEVNTNDGPLTVNASELFIEKSASNLASYLEFRLNGGSSKAIFDATRQSRYSKGKLKDLQNEIQGLADTFAKAPYKNHSGLEFHISNECVQFSNTYSLYSPSYIFDDDDFQKHTNPYLGLQNYGPSDKAFFTPKDVNILVVCHSENRGSFSNFTSTLEKGLSNSPQQRTNYFAAGFASKYKLHRIDFEIEEINDYSIASYLKTLDEYLDRGRKPELVILEIRREFKALEIDENPYYHVKAHLMSQGIPVQFVDNETIKQKRTDAAFFNLITLQMYAKLGGLPWVLPRRGSYDKEIVVGLGTHVERTNRFVGNVSHRVVGITTFFTGEGRYIFGNRCKEVDYEEYFDELLTSLEASINEVSSEYNWRANSTVLIIFHTFKPLKNIEVSVVDELVKKFDQYRIKFAFLTISDRHPYLLFDKKQQGRYGKGEYLPLKGSNLRISDNACVLQVRSIEDVRTDKHGMPKPLQVRLISSEGGELSFKDLSHLTQQVLNFSNLSFSGFQTARAPVTVFYSEKIAEWLSALKRIVGWKPQIVNTELKRKKWFL